MTEKKRKYWYKTTMYGCVLCGKTDYYKERQYTKKPKQADRRFTFIDMACACHFM